MSGNKTRGSVRIDVSGKSVSLALTMNAMCEIEEATGKSIVEVLEQLGSKTGYSLSMMRKLLWASMLQDLPEITEREAGDVLQDLGMTKATELMGEVVQAAFPEADGGGKKTASAS